MRIYLIVVAALAAGCSSKSPVGTPADPPGPEAGAVVQAPAPPPTPVDAPPLDEGPPRPLFDEQDRATLDRIAGTGTRPAGADVGRVREDDFNSGARGTGEPPAAASPEVVSAGTPEGDFGGLTAEEIQRVLLSRKGIMRACYQKELQRKPDLAGTLMIRFTIAPDGTVSATAIDPDRTTLDDPAVASCVQRQFQKLRFPAKGGAKVSYPLRFAAPAR